MYENMYLTTSLFYNVIIFFMVKYCCSLICLTVKKQKQKKPTTQTFATGQTRQSNKIINRLRKLKYINQTLSYNVKTELVITRR